jgi:hypothetical protein
MFRPRTSLRGAAAGSDNPDTQKTVVADLAKYERAPGVEDYRQRMIINAVGLVFIVMLTAAGIWLANTISTMQKNEDCFLSGRRNCAPIDVRALDR